MAADTAGVDRTLGAIGTTFRLMRLYPPTHPAVIEALRQIGEALPALAALGTVEWKVGVTGLHWHGQHLLPRNAQIAELAGLLYARGVRAVTLNPGMTPDHVLALFQVATGAVPPDARPHHAGLGSPHVRAARATAYADAGDGWSGDSRAASDAERPPSERPHDGAVDRGGGGRPDGRKTRQR